MPAGESPRRKEAWLTERARNLLAESMEITRSQMLPPAKPSQVLEAALDVYVAALKRERRVR